MPRAVDRWILQGVQQGVVTAAQLDNIIDIHVVVGARVNPMSGGCIVVRTPTELAFRTLPPPVCPVRLQNRVFNYRRKTTDTKVAGTEHVTRS